ncbi:MAG: hypothetical protein ACRC7R_06795, partial [Sarcina sp.]
MKRLIAILLLFTTISFVGVGCSVEDSVHNQTDIEKISNDKVTYEIFQDSSSTIIEDKEKINEIKKVLNEVLANAYSEFKCYITNEDIDNFKNKGKVLEATFNEEQNFSFKYSDGAKAEYNYVTLYLHENAKEPDGYSFILKDKEGFY